MPDNLNNLDHLIDDVARAITERRVDDGFARRVSVRIQHADARARVPRSRSRAWLLAPAAACVALLAVMIVRQVPSPNVRPTPDRPPQTATADVRLKPDATTETATTNGMRPPDATTGRAATTGVHYRPPDGDDDGRLVLQQGGGGGSSCSQD